MLLSLEELETRALVYATNNKECQKVPYCRNKYGEQSIQHCKILLNLLNLFCQQGIDTLMLQNSAYVICNGTMGSFCSTLHISVNFHSL